MDFLEKIAKSHDRSAMALTLASPLGVEVFLFKFDAAQARKFGALIGACGDLANRAVCLDLTNPQLAGQYSKVPSPQNPNIFYDWGEPEPDDREARARLFELSSRGLSLHMVAISSSIRGIGYERYEQQISAIQALSVSAHAASPVAVWRDEFRDDSWDQVEPGFNFPPLYWLDSATQAMGLCAAVKLPASASAPGPSPKARL